MKKFEIIFKSRVNAFEKREIKNKIKSPLPGSIKNRVRILDNEQAGEI